jgi:hypothetical protein
MMVNPSLARPAAGHSLAAVENAFVLQRLVIPPEKWRFVLA